TYISSFFQFSGSPLHLHSFPTRRSSDLVHPRRRAQPYRALSFPRRRHGRETAVPVRSPLAPPARPAADRGVLVHQPSTAGSAARSEEHTSELQSRENLVCRLLLEKKKRR